MYKYKWECNQLSNTFCTHKSHNTQTNTLLKINNTTIQWQYVWGTLKSYKDNGALMCTYVFWCVLMMWYDVCWCAMLCTDVNWCGMMCIDVYWCILKSIMCNANTFSNKTHNNTCTTTYQTPNITHATHLVLQQHTIITIKQYRLTYMMPNKSHNYEYNTWRNRIQYDVNDFYKT